MEKVREHFPNEFNRGVLRMFVGAKDKQATDIPARREPSFLGEVSRFALFDQTEATAFDLKWEAATPVKNSWLRKTFLPDKLDEMFSEITCKQVTSAEFIGDSTEAVPSTAAKEDRHNAPNKVDVVHSVYQDCMDTSVDEDESNGCESSDYRFSVKSLTCSLLVADLLDFCWEVTEGETANLVSRLESLPNDDASEHPVFETVIGMDAIFSNLEMTVSNTFQQEAGHVLFPLKIWEWLPSMTDCSQNCTVCPLSDSTSNPVVVPGNKAQLIAYLEETKAPSEVESAKKN
ncbi:hypothetical protein CLU79DRAFT_835664 [Phycomyces nitens]|nr:hypothetical protein CLU79DRAFT_835664 [Phycomyces nitens]